MNASRETRSASPDRSPDRSRRSVSSRHAKRWLASRTARSATLNNTAGSAAESLYAEQAQYHAVGVDTRCHSGQQTTVQTPAWSFPRWRLTDRRPYRGVGIGRNGADSEPSCGGGLSAHVTRQYPKHQSVNAYARSVCPSRLLKATHKIPPGPLTPAGVLTAKTTPGRQIWPRIGVPAAWHCQQSTTPMLLPAPEKCGSQMLELRT